MQSITRFLILSVDFLSACLSAFTYAAQPADLVFTNGNVRYRDEI